ncbi:o-succinylbenzoate--CoA ligase [Paenisporosarcina cavernae]|uniref:2-succinylbenzoate--CoA ligase n=1 Tax=Paenisporosarcina cavernae TaxID=2320858 RepID=A0A385YTU2_9BACL|nr:o-succinylbenzoate--CoA ligase [Paenisporosarcina cavernae]AYC29921.1 o-succinylbenzoate--CoA ligase [Paenisporosarcina cavernae]
MYPNFLLKQAKLHPSGRALSFQQKEWTFEQLKEESLHFARKLKALDLSNKDRVAILSSSSDRLVIGIHALWQLGCEIVLLNERLTAAELQYQYVDSEATILLTSTEYKKTLSVPSIYTWEEIDQKEEIHFTMEPYWDDSRTLSIMYTSGTTGSPKGVRQTVRNHATNALSSNAQLGIQESESWLCSMPIYHISGLSILIRSVLLGLEVRLYDKFQLKEIVGDITSGRVTRMSVVSTTLQRIVHYMEENSLVPSSNFRGMLAGGGPIPKDYLERSTMLQLPVVQTYGMTETCSQTATLESKDAIRKIGSAGKALLLADIRIEGATKSGEPGEICITGDHVTNGYIGKYATIPSQQDGWLHTGDIGYLDEEGFLYVLDRRSDLIISGGENIYPAEVESVLLSYPGILDAGVIGIPHEKWGEVPKAFLVVAHSVELNEIETFCKSTLASYKIPKEWSIVNELPRNGAGKLLRRELRT